MQYYLSCAIAAIGLLGVMACGGTAADYEGASNTDPVVEEGACKKLADCCYSLSEQDQGVCLGGVRSSEASKCTADLGQLRASGSCQ